MDDIAEITGDYQSFLKKIFRNLDKLMINVSSYELDHIAYRCASTDNYLKVKNRLSAVSELLNEAIIRDRRIAIFKLDKPVSYGDFFVTYFELMEPAEGDQYREGLEHAEFAIGNDFDSLKKNYPNVEFREKIRKNNPELVIKFPDGLAVKFHPYDIGTAMQRQRETGEL